MAFPAIALLAVVAIAIAATSKKKKTNGDDYGDLPPPPDDDEPKTGGDHPDIGEPPGGQPPEPPPEPPPKDSIVGEPWKSPQTGSLEKIDPTGFADGDLDDWGVPTTATIQEQGAETYRDHIGYWRIYKGPKGAYWWVWRRMTRATPQAARPRRYGGPVGNLGDAKRDLLKDIEDAIG